MMRNIALIALVFILAIGAIWFFAQTPSNNRVWSDDVAHTVTGTVNGNHVTLYNVRNFTWRGETDYDQKWETRTYDLDALSSVDMYLSTWGRAAIAHTLISFGFTNSDYVTFSFEIRKEGGEKFSELAGFFRQYELALIAADERDIIYSRTTTRKVIEDVTMYRVMLTPEQRRALFLSYVDRGNELAQTPKFYNTITANCTTVIYHMVKAIVPGIQMDYRILISGWLPSYIYDLGGLDKNYTLDTLTDRGKITKRAQNVKNMNNFSHDIRAGMPDQ